MKKLDQIKAEKPKGKRNHLAFPKLKNPQRKNNTLLVGANFTPNQKKFLEALRETLGVISKASHISGLHRNNHFFWMKKSVEYKEEYDQIVEDGLDFAEDALYSCIRDREITAIIFYLKTKGKKRGYIERLELTGDKENPLIINFAD